MNRIASDIGSGFLYLHERGIAHRDFKIANVLVSNQHYGEEKNRDKIAYAWSHQPRGRDSHMKQTGMLVGNFEFNP